MKRFFYLSISLLLSLSIHADEGMWILSNLSESKLARMKELGLNLSQEQLYDTIQPSLKDAVIHFAGGCTGVMVSKQGLLFTNHHCGYGAIQSQSSVENDYLRDGFVSQSFEEELPIPNMSVRFLQKTIDVTDQVLKGIDDSMGERERLVLIQKHRSELENLFTDESRSILASVDAYFANNRFFLNIYEIFTDIRLVFAPPTSIGKFGADTDNWMWPRHTCDFSVFRVYANSDNMPAEYDDNNRPYNPKFVAEVSTLGYQENDYAMTMGFPGSTDRYLSSWGVQQRIKSSNEPRIEVRGIKQEIWKKEMQADDAVRIKYASKYASSSNYWKNSIGMNRGLANLNVVEQKQSEEAAFEKWANADENKDIYGDVLKILENGYTSTNENYKYLTYLSEAFSNGAEILRLARMFAQIDNNNLSTVEIEDILNERIRPFLKDYVPEMDQKVLAAMLRLVKERVPQEYLSDIYSSIDKKYKGDFERYSADLFANTAILSESKMIELLKDKKKYDKYMKKDPAEIGRAHV